MYSSSLQSLPTDIDLLWMQHVDYRTLTTQLYGVNKRFSKSVFRVVHVKLTQWVLGILKDCALRLEKDPLALAHLAKIEQEMPKEFKGKAWWQYCLILRIEISNLDATQFKTLHISSLSFTHIEYSELKRTPTLVKWLFDARQFGDVVNPSLPQEAAERILQRMRKLSPYQVRVKCTELAANGHPKQAARYILSFKDLGERQAELQDTFEHCASQLLYYERLEEVIALTTCEDHSETQKMREKSLQGFFGRYGGTYNEQHIKGAGIELLMRFVLSMPNQVRKMHYLFHCVRYLIHEKNVERTFAAMQLVPTFSGETAPHEEVVFRKCNARSDDQAAFAIALQDPELRDTYLIACLECHFVNTEYKDFYPWQCLEHLSHKKLPRGIEIAAEKIVERSFSLKEFSDAFPANFNPSLKQQVLERLEQLPEVKRYREAAERDKRWSEQLEALEYEDVTKGT